MACCLFFYVSFVINSRLWSKRRLSRFNNWDCGIHFVNLMCDIPMYRSN